MPGYGHVLMHKKLNIVVALCLLVSLGAFTAAQAQGPVQDTTTATLQSVTSDLKNLQSQLDVIKQNVPVATNLGQFDAFNTQTQKILAEADQRIALLAPLQQKLRTDLNVLGPVPNDGAEAPAVAQSRIDLTARKAQLDTTLKQIEAVQESASSLIAQIGGIRRDYLKNALALRPGSILSGHFWSPILKSSPEDSRRLGAVVNELATMWHSAWQPGKWFTSAILLLLALGVWTLGRTAVERAVSWVCLHRLPKGRLRRSAVAFARVSVTVLATACVLNLVYLVFVQGQELTPAMSSIVTQFISLALSCALLAGLGRALLSTEHPSRRLPAISDPVALALKPFPSVLAGLLLVFGALENVNGITDASPDAAIFVHGLVTLCVVITIGIGVLRVSRVRKSLAAAGEPAEDRSTLAGLFYFAISGALIASAVALIVGYVPLGRFITYELVWFFLVVCSFYILILLAKDISVSLFSVENASGRSLQRLFNLNGEHLEQVSVIFSGLSTAVLLLLALTTLFRSGFGSTPEDLISGVIDVLGGGGLRTFNIEPARLLNAIITLAVGFYLLRSVRRWFNTELLPKTGMDPGMRASLIAIFGNVGYVLVVMLGLSALGVRWDNLAWIVSALSVGIGFGLQEVVKNFVSGVILLTERPVKVGDLVSVGNVEGDIRRINVRATEIQLSDRSTVIVPNSALISNNLRNVTMGTSSLGVVTLELIFPFDIDPGQVRDLLKSVFINHKAVLEAPSPSVVFSQISRAGITLNVTGYVRSPRIVGEMKSDLLFEVLTQLRAQGISLATDRFWPPERTLGP